MICAGCNKNIKGQAMGSLKHPYCKKCFKEEFNDDFEAYMEILDKPPH